jgi:hypothetical protein
MKTFAILVFAFLVSIPATAQIDQVLTPPPNLVLNNYDMVPVGPYGGLEGSAYAARIGDPSAAWFNPAGLSRQQTAQISGSAGVYQHTSVTPNALPNRGGSIQQLPNYVGFTFTPRAGMTVGAALLTTNAWMQETDSELVIRTTPADQRFAYSADADYERRIAAFGVGFHRGGRWRFGGGFAFSMMDLRLVQSASDRLADSTGLRSLLVSSRVGGSTTQMRLQGGAQYDVGAWRLGAAVRTPGGTILRSGVVTLDGVLDNGPASQGASLFDPDARLEYHLPWEFQGGAAYVQERLEIEVDLQGYTPVSAYSLISSDHPTVTYGDSGAGLPPTIITRPFGGLTSASNGVVNVSAAGHFLLFKERTLRIHGGAGSNRSPVGTSDVIFNKVDLSTWTLGVSGSLAKFQFAAGVNHKSGTADDIIVRNLLNGQVVRTAIDVSTMGFIYSLTYQF